MSDVFPSTHFVHFSCFFHFSFLTLIKFYSIINYCKMQLIEREALELSCATVSTTILGSLKEVY